MSVDLTARRVMRDVDEVSRAGLTLSTFMEEALASISRAVPHVGACVATVDPSTLLLTGTMKFGDLRGRDAQDHAWGIHEYGTPEATAFSELAHRAVPAAATRSQDPGSRRLHELITPNYGYTDELRVVLRDRGQVWGAVALFRGTSDAYFDEHDVALMSRLSESLSCGLRAGLLSGVGGDMALGATGPAVIIVDEQNRVQQLSAGAEERIADLLTSDTGTDPSGIIASLIGAARRYAAGGSAHPPRCRIRARSGMWLVLHAAPLTSRDGTVGHVVVTLDEARPPEIVPLVVAAFDLTPRERDVTQLVLQGLDTKEIAASMHLSRYTVQDHLKSIFEKAEVRSRRELISRIYFDQYVPRMGTDVGPTGWFAAAPAQSSPMTS